MTLSYRVSSRISKHTRSGYHSNYPPDRSRSLTLTNA